MRRVFLRTLFSEGAPLRRALGKGLAQLLTSTPQVEAAEPTVAAVQIRSDTVDMVPVRDIEPNKQQPRRSFDEQSLEELAASIKEYGVIQPLIAERKESGTYVLIAGERRWRAAKMAGLADVPVVVRTATERESLEIALVENVQREDITPMECAKAYLRLTDEFGLSQEQVGIKVGKSRVAISNTLRLLKLPQAVQNGLQEGLITEGHARAILMAQGEEAQLALYQAVVARGLSVRDTESLARMSEAVQRKSEPRTPGPVDPHWLALEDALAAYLGSPVRLQRNSVGGKIILEFYSDEDLQRLLDVFGVRL